MTGQIRSKPIAMSPREIAHYSNDMVLMRNTIIEQTARAEKAETALATARADALAEAAIARLDEHARNKGKA